MEDARGVYVSHSVHHLRTLGRENMSSETFALQKQKAARNSGSNTATGELRPTQPPTARRRCLCTPRTRGVMYVSNTSTQNQDKKSNGT